MAATPTLYGIKNCDSVKKARNWLEQHSIDYTFHDFRTDGLTAEQVEQWLQQVDAERLLNKRSTSWRQLSDERKQNLDSDRVLNLVLEHPTLIKRPVLEYNNGLFIGFREAEYQSIFEN